MTYDAARPQELKALDYLHPGRGRGSRLCGGLAVLLHAGPLLRQHSRFSADRFSGSPRRVGLLGGARCPRGQLLRGFLVLRDRLPQRRLALLQAPRLLDLASRLRRRAASSGLDDPQRIGVGD